MPDPTFSIVNESAPQRCEICHQADFFNPATNFCARCHNVPVTPQPPPLVELNRKDDWERAEYFRQLNERLRENQQLAGVDEGSPMSMNPFELVSGRFGFAVGFIAVVIGFVLVSVIAADNRQALRTFLIVIISIGAIVLFYKMVRITHPQNPQPMKKPDEPSSRQKLTRRDQ